MTGTYIDSKGHHYVVEVVKELQSYYVVKSNYIKLDGIALLKESVRIHEPKPKPTVAYVSTGNEMHRITKVGDKYHCDCMNRYPVQCKHISTLLMLGRTWLPFEAGKVLWQGMWIYRWLAEKLQSDKIQ